MKKTSISLILALALCLGLMGTALAADQTVVRVSNNEELQAAVDSLQSNTTIELEGRDYNAFIYLEGLENITFQGTAGTRIITNDGSDEVLMFYNCKNVTLSSLVLGHEVPQDGGCSSGVVSASECGLTILGCDIFGCGITGISAFGGTLTVKDSTIRDCSSNIMDVSGSAVFQNCIFSGNAYEYADYQMQDWDYPVPAIYTYAYDSDVDFTFIDCTFKNNYNPIFLPERGEYETGRVNLTVTNCLFENNGWSDPATNGAGASASAPAESAAPVQSAGVTANPTSASVLVNGVNTAFDAYSIDGNNYFKLRDLAYVLNGTDKQFEVGFDSATKNITLTSGAAYTAVGGEMTAGAAGSKSASPTASRILLNGQEVSFTAYNIGGNNYFKLRDVGQAFDFGIGWDNASKTITIDTGTGYTA